MVITTLLRTGMPLIRYRTGDITRIIPGQCECGSMLRRIDIIQTRLGNIIETPSKKMITKKMLDECLLGQNHLFDYTATYRNASLTLKCLCDDFAFENSAIFIKQLMQCLKANPVIQSAISSKAINIQITIEKIETHLCPVATKRLIIKH